MVECRAERDHLDAVHATLARFWGELAASDEGGPGLRWRLLFEVAVAEVAANIVEHAGARELVFRVRGDEGRVVAEFEDRGRRWNGTELVVQPADGAGDPGGWHGDLAERGRGLGLARRAVDEVRYEREGSCNRWLVAKWL